MNLNISTDDVLRAVSSILRSSLDGEEDGNYLFQYVNFSFPVVSSDELEGVVSAVNALAEFDDTSVFTKTTYEMLVIVNSPIRTRGQVDSLVVGGEDADFTYRVGPPSEYFALYLWLKQESQGDTALRDLLKLEFALSGAGRERRLPEHVRTVWDCVRYSSRLHTLHIAAKKAQPSVKWHDYVNSFLFQVGYNFGMSILPDRDLRSLSRVSARKVHPRRSGRDDLDVPRRIYVPDLVYHYQLGISSVGSPMLQYLSYYHVAEHWFELVYQDDLIQQVQDRITGPGFSYKRQRDISGLIKLISKAVHLRNDRLVIDELAALRLTIERYVDLDALSTELRQFDPDILDYYANNEVEFCGGNKIAFDAGQVVKAKSLANRIYKTRNALAHSKDGEKGKYTPFVDDGKLVPEIPLVRFIAEQIIIATSEVLD